MEQTKTHWKNLANYDYLGAYSFAGITDKIVLTIKTVSTALVKNEGGKEDNCVIATFEEKNVDGVTIKPMIFNKTNCKTVSALYGDFIEGWPGKKIIVFPTTTTFGRETRPCLRVKKEVPEVKEPKKEYFCEVCGQKVEEGIFLKSKNKYGVGVCSKECLDKYKEKQNKGE